MNEHENENPNPNQHLAWLIFLSQYEPAINQFDCEISLTTDQVLEQLNAIAYDQWYSSTELFICLKDKFKGNPLPGTDSYVWMLKSIKQLSFK